MVNNNKVNKKAIGISVVTSILIILPILIASSYSFLQADDFTHAIDIGVFGGNIIELFVASIKYDITMYKIWQGTYTSMFLQAFLSPLNGMGLIQLKIVMIFNILFFVTSLIFFIYAICKYCNIELDKISIIGTMCLLGIFGFTSWIEIFYWFSGAVSYSFPLSFAFFGISLTILGKSKLGSPFACICMFVASGGSLEVAGTGCFIILMICVIKILSRNILVQDYIVFGVSVIGALINAMAPGNYSRHSLIDNSGLHFINALISTIDIVFEFTEKLLFETPFILVLFGAVVIGLNIGKNNCIRKNNLKVLCVLCVCLPIVTGFPVCLAYSGNAYFPNRCEFVQVTIIVLSLIALAVSIGCFLEEKIKYIFTKDNVLILILFFVVMQNINPSWKISELIPFQMMAQISKDEFKDYYKYVNELYASIGEDESQDVFIYDNIYEIDNFPAVVIDENMNGWVNPDIAQYYGKKSLQYVSSPVYKNTNEEKIIRISPSTFECDLSYVSIFKKDSHTQKVELLQLLQPFTDNMVITVPDSESGQIGIYVFGDKEGKSKLSEQIIEY